MRDGEIELSNTEFLQNSTTSDKNTHYSTPDETLRHANKTCTHTHTCNPPGPDAGHTHTCYHTHTQVFSTEDIKTQFNIPSFKPKSPSRNRVAVRKYREKKKAYTAFLEEEVQKLRVLNIHLVRKLQEQAALEAELSSLRAHLVDLRGMIDVKLGCFPFQNPCSANSSLSFEDGTSIGFHVR